MSYALFHCSKHGSTHRPFRSSKKNFSYKPVPVAAVIFLLLTLMPLLSACSLLASRSATPTETVRTRDVPFQARASQEIAPRKRVMVLPFIDQGVTRSDRVALIAREAVVRALLRTDSFVVVSNNDFPKDLNQFLKNGEFDLEALARLANGMGLAAVIEGKVMDVKAKRIGDEIGLVRTIRAKLDATISLRMIATKNGKIVLSEVRSASMEDSTTVLAERALTDKHLEENPRLIEGAVTKAFQSVVPKIVQAVDKLNWEGRVALVKGDRIYLNAGRLTGIQVGDVLKVTEEGEDVYDPETGILIGRVSGRLKGTIEVVSYFGKDGSVAVVHSGSGFHENDRVELY